MPRAGLARPSTPPVLAEAHTAHGGQVAGPRGLPASHTPTFSPMIYSQGGACSGTAATGWNQEELQLHPWAVQPKEAAGTEEARGPVQARVPAVRSSLLCQLSAACRVWRDRNGSRPLGVYGAITLELSICSTQGKGRGGDTAGRLRELWKRGPWHDSHINRGWPGGKGV